MPTKTRSMCLKEKLVIERCRELMDIIHPGHIPEPPMSYEECIKFLEEEEEFQQWLEQDEEGEYSPS